MSMVQPHLQSHTIILNIVILVVVVVVIEVVVINVDDFVIHTTTSIYNYPFSILPYY